jgi:hypothetical protein
MRRTISPPTKVTFKEERIRFSPPEIAHAETMTKIRNKELGEFAWHLWLSHHSKHTILLRDLYTWHAASLYCVTFLYGCCFCDFPCKMPCIPKGCLKILEVTGIPLCDKLKPYMVAIMNMYLENKSKLVYFNEREG